MSCIFCEIINGRQDAYRIYEDTYTLAFLDIANDMDGHIIVIPKQHVSHLWELREEYLHALMDAVQAISLHCVEHCGYDGVNILHASGTSAGQSVPHVHFHLLPRKHTDGVDAWPTLPGAKKSLAQMQKELSMIQEEPSDDSL